MIEAEIKLPIYNIEELTANLLANGFRKDKKVLEQDIYFNSPLRDFRKSDEALRIRSVTNLETGTGKALLTYKGPKLDLLTMTRKEVETPVEEAEKMESILSELGYKEKYPVIKTRQYYKSDEITACVDQVQDLGDFLELEILIEDEAGHETALQKLEECLDKLGHHMGETIRVSYLSMLMKQGSR